MIKQSLKIYIADLRCCNTNIKLYCYYDQPTFTMINEYVILIKYIIDSLLTNIKHSRCNTCPDASCIDVTEFVQQEDST